LKKSSDDVGDFDVSDGFIFSSDRIGAWEIAQCSAGPALKWAIYLLGVSLGRRWKKEEQAERKLQPFLSSRPVLSTNIPRARKSDIHTQIQRRRRHPPPTPHKKRGRETRYIAYIIYSIVLVYT
jgi:hypothetical protein